MNTKILFFSIIHICISTLHASIPTMVPTQAKFSTVPIINKPLTSPIISPTSYPQAKPFMAKPLTMPTAKLPNPSFAAKTAQKTYSIALPIAYDINIINTSTIPATLNSITIEYTSTQDPDSIKSITATTHNTIDAKQGLSFTPQITIKSTNQNISAQFQGIKSIVINGQTILFKNAEIGTSPIYINNVNNIWKKVRKPTKKTRAKASPQAPKISTIKSATVPYINKTQKTTIKKSKANKISAQLATPSN